MDKIKEIVPVYDGKFLHFYNFKLESGRNYEVISRQKFDNIGHIIADAVDIIALSPDFKKVLVIKEWRVPINNYIYAFPAGLCEPGEDIITTATRELFEETGLKMLDVLDILPPAYQSAGMSNEAVATVICTAVGEITNKNATQDEDISPMWITEDEATDMVFKSEMSGRCQMFLYLFMAD